MGYTFRGSFIVEPLFFKTELPVNSRKKRWTVNDKRHLTLLRKKVPCLREKDILSVVRFMRDGAASHPSNPVKEFSDVRSSKNH
ncbi:hypothetical protein TNCT_263731 [Trichonephila clavata]|uniref:Uncharacterized protein n=1 Tax=Trichonephila clavata TaxID=2740835 RepID=A0A8X6J248_TRICU|nr:hypothetical protein TNCT_263731 [Trichonephila clavata]